MMIVGLGNPGDTYHETRHNAGFWLVDRLATHWGMRWSIEKKCHAKVAKRSGLLLVKPSTYMNHSGQAVQAVRQYFKHQGSLVVLYDELAFQPGHIRFKQGGSAGGHNGIKSVIAHVGSDFWRVRIGIGSPIGQQAIKQYVLLRPAPQEKQAIVAAMRRLLQDGDRMLNEQWDWLMNHYHGREG